MSRTAVVLGAAGFIGRAFTAALFERDYEIVGIDPRGQGPVAGRIEHADRWLPDRPDLVINAMRHDEESRQLAADATALAWMVDARPARVVHCSSARVYPAVFSQLPYEALSVVPGAEPDVLPGARPVLETDAGTGQLASRMGQVRWYAERLAAQLRDRVLIPRLFSVYGPGARPESRVASLARRFARAVAEPPYSPCLMLSEHGMTRDYLHIDDVVAAVLALVDAGVHGPVNICSGQGVDELELAAALIEAYELDPERVHCSTAALAHPAVYVVGNPSVMARHYTPRIKLSDGLRALATGSRATATTQPLGTP